MMARKPKRFLTDRRSGFIGNKFERFLKNNGIHQLTTSTQRPQCNGMNERMNQTIVTQLKCKINKHPRTALPRPLAEVIEEYNSTSHEVTVFLPAFLMFGTLPYSQLTSDSAPSLEEARKAAVKNKKKYHH